MTFISEMETAEKDLTMKFERFEETTLKQLHEFGKTALEMNETTKKNMREMNETTKKLMRDLMRESSKETKELLSPLFKKMENFEKFKENTVNHLVSLTKQIQGLQKEMDTVKETLSSSIASIKSCNENIEQMSKKIAEISNSNNNNNNSNNNSNNNDNNNDNNSNSHNQTCEQLESLSQKINELEVKSKFWELNFQSTPSVSQSGPTPHELQLQKSKENNLIIFGMRENPQDASWNDKDELQALLSDLGSTVNLDETNFFCVGRNLERSRPLILKLNQDKKAKILFKAKNLKNNQRWAGVAITHDLTKLQCQEEKAQEAELKRIAEEKNQRLHENDKAKRWRVIGGRGTRRLVLTDL